MDTLKRIFLFTITSVLIFSVFSAPNNIVSADDKYKGNEAYWDNLCKSAENSSGQYKDDCDGFKQYLQDQVSSADQKVQEILKNKDEITGNIEKDYELLKEANLEIIRINEEIENTNKEIRAVEYQITRLTAQIAEREKVIEERIEQAKKYMLNMQPTTRINSLVEFVLGSSEFAEVSRRVEGMNLINQQNLDNLRKLNEEKELLEEDKIALGKSKDNLVIVLNTQKEKKKTSEELASAINSRVAKLRVEYDRLLAAQEDAEQTKKLAVSKISNIGSIVETVGGMSFPMQAGTYTFSAGQWYYPGTNIKHLGLDVHTWWKIGVPVYSPANGKVLAINEGCPTIGNGAVGGSSSNCKSGYGNYVLLMMQVDGKVYGALLAHFAKGSVAVSPGQDVKKGQQVGGVGSSGNSTGPHLHYELFYLGTDLQAAYDRWYSNPTVGFGSPGKNTAGEPGFRCENNGNSAPCRINVAKFYGM